LPGRARRGGRLRLPAVLLLAGLVWPPPVVGAQTPMPPDRQVPLILKVLTYDRQFEAKAGAGVNIGIVYSPADANSSKITTEIAGTLNKFSGKTVKRLPINYWTIEYVSPARLEEVIKDKGINVIYVSPGNDKNLDSILKLSQARKITTTTGVPDYVRKGVLPLRRRPLA